MPDYFFYIATCYAAFALVLAIYVYNIIVDRKRVLALLRRELGDVNKT